MTDAYAALRIPYFRYLIAVRFLAILAIMMQAVAVGWQIYAMTNDPLSLGLVGLAEALPALSISLFAGHIVDHHNRRKILRIALGVFGAMALMLCLLSAFPNQAETWPFYLAVIVGGLARAFLGPAIFSLTGHVVPKELYANATTWSTTLWQTGAALGPLIAGFVYIVGPEWVYGLEALVFLATIILVGQIPPTPRARLLLAPTPVMKSLWEGIRFVAAQPIIFSVMALDMLAVLFGGAVAMLPVFAKDILMVGPVGLGWLRAMPALGAILVAVHLAHNPPRQVGKVLLGCVTTFGLCMIGFGFSTSFILSLGLLFVSGLVDGVSVVLRGTIIQTLTPDEMRGRVASVNMMFIGSSNELGAFESGVAARLMGLVPSVVFGGIMTLVVVAVTAMKSPQLRKLKL